MGNSVERPPSPKEQRGEERIAAVLYTQVVASIIYLMSAIPQTPVGISLPSFSPGIIRSIDCKSKGSQRYDQVRVTTAGIPFGTSFNRPITTQESELVNKIN